ncbi:20271_t:CDS:2, partial [Dentiscutata erythropus]
MVRKTRSDKKDTICKRCGHKCSTPQKLREHLKRKNLYKLLQNQKNIASIQIPIKEPIQEDIQEPVQVVKTTSKDTPFKNPDIEWNYQNMKRKLGIFKNLQQESYYNPEEFDRKRFYIEMKKE